MMSLFGTNRFGVNLMANYLDLTNYSTLALSNIGRVGIDSQYDDFAIANIGFAASFPIPTRLGLFAASISDVITLNFVGMEPLYSREHIERLADSAIEILRNNMD